MSRSDDPDTELDLRYAPINDTKSLAEALAKIGTPLAIVYQTDDGRQLPVKNVVYDRYGNIVYIRGDFDVQPSGPTPGRWFGDKP